MPTDTFTIAGNSDDAHGRQQATTWASIASGTYTDNIYGSDIIPVFALDNPPDCQLLNNYLRWDTSSIPDSATITSAVLKIYVQSQSFPDTVKVAFDFYDFGGTPSTSGDWQQTPAGDAIAAFGAGTLTDGVVNSISLTGLTGISKTGFTGLRGSTDSRPTAGPGGTYVNFASYDHASQPAPQLEVTYTTGAVEDPFPIVAGGYYPTEG